MARTRKTKFDASDAITNELIRIIERGVLPWRQPWKAGGSAQPLRHSGEAYQGINNILLTMRTCLAGYSSPYWMTFNQAKELGGSVRKGERSAIVVYYGTADRSKPDREADPETDDGAGEDRVIRFQKSYRVFNANQIDGLPDRFTPASVEEADHPGSQPIPHIHAFFEAIDIETVFTGRKAYYLPAVDRVYMPEISLFDDARSFYGVWGHELAHATKARHRLNRDYGGSRFGNTGYAREEIVAELTAVLLGQRLGFVAHTLEMNAAYLDNWLRVLRSDKTAIFKHAADAQKACDWLIEASRKGQGSNVEQAA